MTTRLAVLTVGILFTLVSAASAQSRDPYFTDLSANYDFIYHEPGATSNAGAHFDVASTFKRTPPFIGPVGEVGFNHYEGNTVVDVMGGLRIRANTDYWILPYAQFLAGLAHCCGVNDFALQGAGGLDFRTGSPDIRIRLQVDFRHVFDTEGFNAARVSAGIVLPLNK